MDATSFEIKDCALSAISVGRRAQNLKELLDGVRSVPGGSIYHHFWGRLLYPAFDDPEYNNDFASWVRHQLHDHKLAERLAVIDPAQHGDLEKLRQAVADAIEERLEEVEIPAWTPIDRQFHFIRAQTVVFDTRHSINDPAELAAILPTLSLGSLYYHVIDARRREPLGLDDFSGWIGGLGPKYLPLTQKLFELDPYFVSLAQLRDRLTAVFSGFFGKGAA